MNMSDSRRKREARLRRCLEAAPQVEAIIADEDDAYESADYDTTDAVALKSPRPSGEATNATRNSFGAPKVSLRSFFPETWLFTLDPVNALCVKQ